MPNRVLCVDDEPNVLEAMQRQFRKVFEIETALGPELGLQAIEENGPFAVVISDLRMPGMDGIQFLSRAKQLAPNTVRVMLSGQADLGSAIRAVNQGSVFQFLTKPCPTEMLDHTLRAALEQHRLITGERELLEQTLRGSIGVLSEILSLANPLAFSRAQRIRHYVRHLAPILGLPDQWQYELAAMLSQIGCVAVPPDILEKFHIGEPLSADEARILASQPQTGHDLLARIPRLEAVAEMVAHQHDAWTNRGGQPESIKMGAHLLKVALDFDNAIIHSGDVDEVLNRMRTRSEYNPAFITALQQVHVEQNEREIRLVTVNQLRTRMIIHADVFSKNGLLLLAKGHEVTGSAIFRLLNFAQTVGVEEPITVVVPYATSPTFEGSNIPGPGALPQ